MNQSAPSFKPKRVLVLCPGQTHPKVIYWAICGHDITVLFTNNLDERRPFCDVLYVQDSLEGFCKRANRRKEQFDVILADSEDEELLSKLLAPGGAINPEGW